ncbi:unnamed protein product [Symbiodinium necroappetens]|uniref:Uncharacterized protein n=1 Tax=Symbiodinium necroappetens TaxID=1628268 RepID=A0A812T7F8_9DINO|nr:unnamed protein product [Symbiodinium necroappetens]
MPQELGRFLRRHGQPTCSRSRPEEDAPDEQHGSFLDMQGAADELAATSVRCVQAVGAAIGPLRLLMLGLRCVRAEYLQRLDAWASAMTVSLSESAAPAGPLLPRSPAAPDRAHTWLRTPEGRSLLMELRWLAPDRHTAVNRLRSVFRSNQSNDRLADILTESGVPMRIGAVLSWGASQATWAVYRQALQHGRSQQGRQNRNHAPGAEGAHAVYRLQTEEAVQLCPDCHWLWIVSYRAFPSAQQLDIPPDISSHMDRVAAECLPAAGFGSPQVAQSRQQRISRFLARWLRYEWAQLIQAAQDYILRRGSLVQDFELILTQLQQVSPDLERIRELREECAAQQAHEHHLETLRRQLQRLQQRLQETEKLEEKAQTKGSEALTEEEKAKIQRRGQVEADIERVTHELGMDTGSQEEDEEDPQEERDQEIARHRREKERIQRRHHEDKRAMQKERRQNRERKFSE